VVPDDEVVSQAEAAQRLGVSREYISQLVEAGKVKTIVREAAAPRSRKQPREMVFVEALEALRAEIKKPRVDGTRGKTA
jgi:DNA-binding transcriptional regulator LsrR (DeoR family)